ncbi:MAG: 2,3-bisphosphoglycerate-independent phosphoglycerate mutase [Cyanobacteria bacterium P01_H01_bin.74]
MTQQKSPVLLLILDGWGIREDSHGNAIKQAAPTAYNALLDQYPNITLDASGEAVGLPVGQMGNSEVGHLNMGAGRVVYQEITRINKAIRERDFFENETLLAAMHKAKKNQSTLHLMGLVSNGGVHSSLDHLLALLDMAKEQGIDRVKVHAFLDGRDVPPKSAEPHLETVEKKLSALNYDQIATVSGRYYAMDRDNRWQRTELAYEAIVNGNGRRHPYSVDALLWSYKQEVNDEFVVPALSDLSYEGIKDNDSIVFFNFRPDRARQLSRAISQACFDGFKRSRLPEGLGFTSMTLYDAGFKEVAVAYPKIKLNRLLGEIVSENGLKQFRTAETEKYAHVTFFFNGGFEDPYPGEDRHLIPSPQVATYDLQPEMHVAEVANSICSAIDKNMYDLIVANFANPDMVGHTGILQAAEDAVVAIDQAIKKVSEAILAVNGTMLLTADHGNCETMIDEDGGPHTAHTTNLVPLILVSNNTSYALDQTEGIQHTLSEISPTILDLLGLPTPPEMTSKTLLVKIPVTNYS